MHQRADAHVDEALASGDPGRAAASGKIENRPECLPAFRGRDAREATRSAGASSCGSRLLGRTLRTRLFDRGFHPHLAPEPKRLR